MAKNNQFSELDQLLKYNNEETRPGTSPIEVYAYARFMAQVENVVVVISDHISGTSRIFCGQFAGILGLDNYSSENSIWEKRLLALMPANELEFKLISELRFFHHVRRLGKNRANYYLKTQLRLNGRGEGYVNVLHRMFYVYDQGGDGVRFSVCIYGPLSEAYTGKSMIVNSLTGMCEELQDFGDKEILSRREQQVLLLIDSGMKSKGIAERLNISVHTVSRHRQDILSKLQVRNSIEACRIAKALEII